VSGRLLTPTTMTPLYTDSTLLASDLESFRRQESIFTVLNLLLIGALFLTRMIFREYMGSLSPAVVATLVAGFTIEAAELIWLQIRAPAFSAGRLTFFTWWSIALNSILVAALLILTRGEDSQYFVLMAVPVLEAAFRLRLGPLLAVVAIAVLLNFLGAYSLHSVNEYVEAGASSLIFAMVGVIVWLLVNNLRDGEAQLRLNLRELERTREQLLSEEKLAAVGRLSGAIAHEIRNPVAMISSSLATAQRPGLAETERREMFAIAASEAQRLAQLTSDFLAYARPHTVRLARSNVADTLNYVASVAGAHAAGENVPIDVEVDAAMEADYDDPQMQQALLNLVLNAIDACHGQGRVTLRAATGRGGAVLFEVCNSTGPIATEVIGHLFEPFFTTKAGGTGLGLAIARNIARAHRGDLALSRNEPGLVSFSIEIPASVTNSSTGVNLHDGHNTHRR
jgi:signal transduction histidine kinase